MRRLLVAAALALAAGCTDEPDAARALQAQGFTHVEFTGYDAWTCGKGDDTCTGFTATGPTGVRTSGAVGCGYLIKGCTVRFK